MGNLRIISEIIREMVRRVVQSAHQMDNGR